MSHCPTDKQIEEAYALAKERYAQLGVDSDRALSALSEISISLHCWQGDDVTGFENTGESLSGGIAATGNYPGKARNAQELRRDLDKTYSLIPGTHRLNLHALYAETGGQRVERNELRPEHFAAWVDWAKPTSTASISTPRTFRIPGPPTISRSPAMTRASASSGSSTASPVARSASISGASWAHHA